MISAAARPRAEPSRPRSRCSSRSARRSKTSPPRCWCGGRWLNRSGLTRGRSALEPGPSCRSRSKSAGSRPPKPLMSRSMREPTWWASCSFRRARATSRSRRRARWQAACRAGRARSQTRWTPTIRCSQASSTRSSPTCSSCTATRRRRPDLDAIPLYTKNADRLLFDARPPRDATRPGGLGKPFDWHLLKDLDLSIPFMLSGGLSPLNVVEALRITRAPGVDVSSGVESAPGVKDPEKIRAFIRAARSAKVPA
jgi:hypothetical protein